jgi:uncharacterized protein (TIGR04255 family)
MWPKNITGDGNASDFNRLLKFRHLDAHLLYSPSKLCRNLIGPLSSAVSTDMPETLAFEPIFPAHAIERCATTIYFDQQLPAKVFQKVIERADALFRNAGYERGGAFGVNVDAATGQVSPIGESISPANYVSPDRSNNFLVTSNALSMQTGRYVRWEPFIGQFEELMVPLVSLSADVVSIAGIQLDYLDRFFWTGNWENFDWRGLLQDKSDFVTDMARRTGRQWHCHSGWFEECVAPIRRLVNVNIDVVDAIRLGHPEPSPSISILTLFRDHIPVAPGQPVSTGIQSATLVAALGELHRDLKILLSRIITAAAAERIGLRV